MALRALKTPAAPRAASLDLQAAFNDAMSFPTSRASNLQLAPAWIEEKANEETSFGRIVVEDNGLTSGTRLHVIEPARALLAEWKEARRRFDVAIEPVMAHIKAVTQS